MTDAPKGPWRIFLETRRSVWTLSYREKAAFDSTIEYLSRTCGPGQTLTITDDLGMARFSWNELLMVRSVDWTAAVAMDKEFDDIASAVKPTAAPTLLEPLLPGEKPPGDLN